MLLLPGGQTDFATVVAVVVASLALGLKSRGPHWGLLLVGFSFSFGGVSAMLNPAESQLVQPNCVGKFPWRLQPADRALHESVHDGRLCRMLSPFALHEDLTIEVTSDHTVEDVRLALAGSEPAWSQDIVPVWPAPAHDYMITPHLCLSLRLPR